MTPARRGHPAGRVPRWMQRVEAPFYKLAGTRPEQSMHWLRYALAALFVPLVFAWWVLSRTARRHVNRRKGGPMR